MAPCCTFVQHGTGTACFWCALCAERRGLVSWLRLFVAFELQAGGERLADVAKKHGACVGIEGAYGHVCYTPDVLAEVIKAIDRDNIRVIFDLFNYLSDSNYKSAYDLLGRAHELFGKQILLYHVKDFTATDGAVRQCGVGRGVLNYRRILKEIYAVNPDAILVLEDTTGENIYFAVNYLKEILAEIEK